MIEGLDIKLEDKHVEEVIRTSETEKLSVAQRVFGRNQYIADILDQDDSNYVDANGF